MLGGFGSIQGMINALKANRAVLGERIKYFERGSRFSGVRKEYLQAKKGRLFSKELSAVELNEIRERVLSQGKKDQRIKLMSFFGILLVVAFSVYWNQESLFPASNRNAVAITKMTVEEQERFLYCIKDGDDWLRKNGWHNAVFQYEEALRLNPGNSAVKKRLAIAYTYHCRNTQGNCDKAKSAIEDLIKSEPSNAKHHELLASYYNGVKDSISALGALDNAALLSRLA